MSEGTREGTLLWEPSAERRERSNLARYMEWLAASKGRRFADYGDLWRWSVAEIGPFWESLWEYFGVRAHAPYRTAIGDRAMPGTRWFEGATLNYAEHALRLCDEHLAVLYRCEDGTEATLSRAELCDQVGRAAEGLRRLGVSRGDRVAAFLPNCPEALIGFLATASLGAVWSSCSPEFGKPAVLDRFRQIEPRVLLAVDRTPYAGQLHDRLPAVVELRAALPSVEHLLLVRRSTDRGPAGALSWQDLCAHAAEPRFVPVPFDHPLWILYSSGTTGLPKAIVQGHGGILLEHMKALSLHMDLGPGDRFFWFTTTGWMMWNVLASGLLVGSTVLLYEGSPAHPDFDALWRLAEETRMTYFGTSAPYLMACRKAGLSPGRSHDLSALRAIGSTGAPLPPEGFGWVYEHVGRDLLLGSLSGGTDVCTAFILSCPLLPVHAGEIQCRALGAKVESFDPEGRPTAEVGELVVTEPLPSMPVSFWNDADGRRLRESYFDVYPGVWRHGDWLKITPRGSCVVYGRSDSTLNRGGVRMGTSELYRVVEDVPEVADSLVVDTGSLEREGRMWLFVVLRGGATLDEALCDRIRRALRESISPRHVPDEIRALPAVPRTLSGKKLEVPVKRILMGEAPERACSRDTLADPSSLDPFVALRGEG